MSDAFISYSRRDTEFVKKLYNSFAALKRDVWVDWEDIPLSSDWRAEITDGVVKADTFIFIVSKDSAVSEECRKEIEIAIQNNKRIIPIALYSLTGDAYKALHPAISAHNWIYCRQDVEDYDTVFNAIINTIDSDLGHVREHTRLLVRAQEWQAKQHNSSALLVGSEIQDAEQWLAHGQDKTPLPTELHARYILTSRQAETARQRRLMMFAVGALIAMAFLAIFAVLKSFEATANANTARSRELAANAQSAMANGQFDLAIALGLKSNEVPNAPSDVLLTLGQAAYAPGARRVLEYADGNIQSVALSQDGKQVVFSSDDNTLTMRNLESGDTLHHYSGYDFLITSLVLSSDGSTFLTGSNDSEGDGEVILWDVNTEEIKQRFQANAGAVLALAYTADGTGALATYADGSIVTWKLEDGSEIGRFKSQEAELAASAFSADASLVASASLYDDTAKVAHIVISKAADNEAVAAFDSTLAVQKITFSPDAKSLLVSGLAMELWDIESSRVTTSFPSQSGVILQTAFSPDGRVIVSASQNNLVRLWDAQNGQQIRQYVGHSDAVNSVVFVPGIARIVSGSDDKTLRLWDLTNALQQTSFSGAARYISGIAFSNDDSQMVTGSWDASLDVWDTATQKSGDPFVLPNQLPVDRFAYSPATNTALALVITNIYAWSPGAEKSVYQLNGLEEFSRAIAISPDGTQVVSGDTNGKLYLWDLTAASSLPTEQPADGSYNGLDPVKTFQLDNFLVGSVSFSPDGKQIVLGEISGGSGSILVFDLTGEKVVWQKTASADGSYITAVKFSPKGDLVLSAGDDPAIQLWDAKNGNFIRALSGHGGNIVNADFNPDGTLIVSASSTDGTVRLWNSSSGQELNRVLMDNQISTVDFTNTGDEVAVGFSNGGISLWDIRSLELKTLITWIGDNRYVHPFNCIEQQQYRIEPLEATCKA